MSVSQAPRRSPRAGALAIFAVTAFFTTAALAHVWVRLQVVRLGYEISRETDREKWLLQVHRKLEVERALLRNPARLERLARDRLNLTMPDPEMIQRLVARPKGSARGPGRASRGVSPVATKDPVP